MADKLIVQLMHKGHPGGLTLVTTMEKEEVERRFNFDSALFDMDAPDMDLRKGPDGALVDKWGRIRFDCVDDFDNPVTAWVDVSEVSHFLIGKPSRVAVQGNPGRGIIQ